MLRVVDSRRQQTVQRVVFGCRSMDLMIKCCSLIYGFFGLFKHFILLIVNVGAERGLPALPLFIKSFAQETFPQLATQTSARFNYCFHVFVFLLARSYDLLTCHHKQSSSRLLLTSMHSLEC